MSYWSSSKRGKGWSCFCPKVVFKPDRNCYKRSSEEFAESLMSLSIYMQFSYRYFNCFPSSTGVVQIAKLTNVPSSYALNPHRAKPVLSDVHSTVNEAYGSLNGLVFCLSAVSAGSLDINKLLSEKIHIGADDALLASFPGRSVRLWPRVFSLWLWMSKPTPLSIFKEV